MSQIPSIFPPEIHAYLREFMVRKRKVALVKALGIAVAAGLMGMLLSCGMDRLQPLPRGVRLFLLLADLATMLILLARPIFVALLRPANWVTTAEEIEGQNPAFAQRLLTITSQLLTPAPQRASQQILDHLVGEVSAQAREGRADRLVPWWWARRPWIAAGALVLAGIILALIPWLNLPRLIHRFTIPLADIAPVTTTHITVLAPATREIGVSQGEPLSISAAADHLGDDSLFLCVSDDGKNWSQQAMEPTSDGQFRLSIASVDRDMRFYLKGGDASTPMHDVRVLRRPAVAEFRVHYTYPAYTHLEPRTVSNTDGVIEAPAGSTADITVVATEPLAQASLSINGKKFDAGPTVDPTSRQLKLAIDHDAMCSLSMSSVRGVIGTGPTSMAIHAIVDQPPIVRLIQPATDLRLSLRDLLDVSYQALDQYGIASLSLHVRVNGSKETDIPIAIHGDARLQQDTIPLDLATLPLSVGDVVTMFVVAEDVSGQKQLSATRNILIVPRSIDINTHERILELQQAVSLAEAWAADVDSGRRSADESRQYADPESDKRADALASTARYLGSAFETSMLLRQSLMRALGRSASPAMSDGLANFVDVVTLRSGAMGRVASRLVGVKPVDDEGMNALNDAANVAHDLARQVRLLAEGESASAILVDRADLLVPTTQPGDRERARHARALQRAREEIAAAVKELGLDPNASDLDARLQDRAVAEQQWAANQKPIDFVTPANQFIEALRQTTPATTDLEPRLAAAAEVEAVRPDTDMVGARDLQLASRVAAVMAEAKLSAADNSPLPAWFPESIQQYPSALDALRNAHTLKREAAGTHSVEQSRQITDLAVAARVKMERWLHGTELATSQPATNPSAADLAMAADAAMAQHDYNKAAELDNKLLAATRPSASQSPAQIPMPREKLNRTMNELQQLDQIAAAQAKVQQETQEAEPKSGIDPPDGLADRQQKIADDIDKARKDADPDAHPGDDSKKDATAAIQGAQEQLAQLPQQMDAAQRAADAARSANARMEAAMNSSRGAQGDGARAAQLAADQARQESDAAQQRLNNALRPISPESMQQLADNLRWFAPETTDAAAAMDQQLTPAMKGLEQSMQVAASGGDTSAVDRSANQSLAALSAVQEALRGAQSQITQRDPLVAAKWFAQAAKQALSQRPPNYKFALTQQQQTASALSEAWNQTAHGIAKQRLARTPGLASIYEPFFAVDGQGSGASSRSNLSAIPSLREWGRLRPLDVQSLNASSHDADPAGYEESLKLYFEAMNKPAGATR